MQSPICDILKPVAQSDDSRGPNYAPPSHDYDETSDSDGPGFIEYSPQKYK